MQFNPTPNERGWKKEGYQSPQQSEVAHREPSFFFDQETRIENLVKGAPLVIEKNPSFASSVNKLLNKYGISGNIPLSECENLVKHHPYEPEMVIAMARVLENKH